MLEQRPSGLLVGDEAFVDVGGRAEVGIPCIYAQTLHRGNSRVEVV